MSNADMISTAAFITRPVCQRKGHLPVLDVESGCPDPRVICKRCGEEVNEEGELI